MAKMFIRELEVPIYSNLLYFLVCSEKQMKNWLRRKFSTDLGDDYTFQMSGASWRLDFKIGGYMIYFIWLDSYSNQIEDHTVLSHEICHHVNHMFYDLGMAWSEDSDEAYAYYDSWVTGELLKFLNEYREEQDGKKIKKRKSK